jgi:hypothetical protein
MTRDDIIRMAREAGGYVAELPNGDAWLLDDAVLQRFAALVAADLRTAAQQALEVMQTNAYAVVNEAPHRDVMAYYEAIAALVDALEQPEQDQFCDSHCTWLDHHPECVRAKQERNA